MLDNYTNKNIQNMKYLLLIHGNNGYANEPHCLSCSNISILIKLL